jgi:hypothetical protein
MKRVLSHPWTLTQGPHQSTQMSPHKDYSLTAGLKHPLAQTPF